MNAQCPATILVALIFLGLGFSSSQPVGAERVAHVVLIVIDGVRPDVLQEANTPNIDALAAEGSYTWNAWTVRPSGTIAAVPAIFTGATPEVHGVTDWRGEIHAETLVEVFNEAGLTSAIVGNDAILGGYSATYCTGYYSHPEADKHFTDIAIKWFTEYRPFFLAVYNPMPDKRGHEFGHWSEEYKKAIEDADFQIGRIVNMLKELGVYERTLVVITTDHGMTGRSHGAGTTTDMRIFSIFKGPGVKQGYQMVDSLQIPPMEGSYARVRIHAVRDDSWSENSLAWNNQPALDDIIADDILVDSPGWYSWDITSFVAEEFAGDKVLSIGMVDSDENLPPDHAAAFEAREWWNITLRPHLEVQYLPSEGPNSTIRLVPIEDSYVRWDASNSNFGATTYLYVGRYRDGAERAFLKFDIGAIPANSSIVEAKYNNYCWGLWPASYEETFVAHRIIDIAPTIAELVGLRPPADAEGEVISQIFEDIKYSVGVTLDRTEASGVSGDVLTYILTITNTGSQRNTFNVKVKSMKNWLVEVFPSKLTLEAGEDGIVFVNILIPDLGGSDEDNLFAIITGTGVFSGLEFRAVGEPRPLTKEPPSEGSPGLLRLLIVAVIVTLTISILVYRRPKFRAFNIRHHSTPAPPRASFKVSSLRQTLIMRMSLSMTTAGLAFMP